MLEESILENLLNNEDYLRRVIPYLKSEYFGEKAQQLTFEMIASHVGQYNVAPTQDELLIELGNRHGLTQETFSRTRDVIQSLGKRAKASSLDYLIDVTEAFCKDKSVYNAVVRAAGMLNDPKSNLGELPDMLKDALAVSFDNAIGHDFIEDIHERYKALHQTNEGRIPFDIDLLNEITGGGLPKKTLNIIVAGTGAGKSLIMCHAAAKNLLNDLNVLYITMEMAEERISERIDANLLDMPLGHIATLGAEQYERRLRRVLEGCKGRLIVKEYPTASASVSQFRALLNDLKLKKDFVPDILYVDYINICASSRYKAGAVNSYTLVKGIAEELRGLAIEYDLPIVSATQLNRQGMGASDVGLSEVSESHGLSATADLMLAMIRTEELDQQNMVLFKQLKNRYGDMAKKLRFVCGVDRSRMKLTNVAAEDQIEDEPVANGSPEGWDRVSIPRADQKRPKVDGNIYNNIGQ